MYMRSCISGFLLCACFSAAFAGEAANKFCGTLQSTNAVPLGPYALYYTDANGNPVLVSDGMTIPRVSSFFYYIHADNEEFGKPKLLNIKMVFKTGQKIANSRIVSLHNSVWSQYSDQVLRQIHIDCGNVDPGTYDNFHLEAPGSVENYCLQHHFHQKSPIETLATPESRRSFAFQDMLPEDRPDMLAALFTLLGPSPVQAAEQNESTTKISDIRSSIENFSFSKGQDNCVEIKPQIPPTADTAHIRITFHSGTYTYFDSRDWRISFTK
jgi:hypothetical protein